MDTLKPRPCPIERLVAHSEEHFIPKISAIAGAHRRDDGRYDVSIDRPVTRAEATAIFLALGVDYREPPSPPTVESFEQLAARRAGNMDLLIQFLKRLAQRSPSPEALERVNEAIGNVTGAKFELLAAAGR